MKKTDKNDVARSVKTLATFGTVIGLGLFLLGCQSTHNSGAANAKTPTVPFDAMVIRHTVADYDKWKRLFDGDARFREAAGVHAIGVARGMENANDIEIPTQIDDLQKAKAFGANPRLKDVMQKGGVISAPDIKLIHILRFADAGKCNYLELTCEVKDFDAWLKVFDDEGPEAREKDGLIDVVLGHGIEDPNLVYLVFKIRSVSEANTALMTPARQKRMQDGRVEGKPTVYFGSDQ